MVSTMLSATATPWGLDRYMSPATAAHDQSNPNGPSARVEYCSTIGDCRPETYLADVYRTRDDFGQSHLDVVTYHVIFSHSHEELDPDNPFHVCLAHQFAREAAARSFPGRQIKIVTQADNGRWEQDDSTGERVWVRGKIHSHCQVANVAEEAVTLEWIDKDGNSKTAHYPAGRAVSSDMKNINRIRYGVVDAVVAERFAFDNEAYMRACREYARATGAVAADRTALSRQADGKTNYYDELRMRLRIARAQATSWDDYEARLAADGVHVLRRGGRGDGVSYKWVDAGSGVTSRPARAGGRSGVGEEFKYASVVEQCAANAAALERGEALDVPERVLVVPSNSVAPDRPRPQYQTEDGLPPWENAEALAAYETRVQSTGGTYEARAERALVTGEPVGGVALVRGDSAVAATVDVGDGPVIFDVDAALAERVAEIEAAQGGLTAREGALVERETTFEADRVKTVAAVNATIDEANAKFAEADEALASARADREAAARARQAGYQTGLDEGRAAWEQTSGQAYREEVRDAAVKQWEREERPGLVSAAKVEGREQGRTEALQEAADDLESARKDREAAAAHLHEVSGLTPEEATDRMLDEFSAKSKKALERYPVNAVEYDENGKPRRVVGADGKPVVTNAWKQMQVDVARDRGPDVTVGQVRRDGERFQKDLDAKAGQVRDSERRRTPEKGFGQ